MRRPDTSGDRLRAGPAQREIIVENASLSKTPYTAPDGSGYLELLGKKIKS